MKFYLGVHQPQWLDDTTVPLFVSRRQLYKRRTFPRATCRWALDSGGFTEISQFGEWRVTSAQYLDEVRRFRDEVGGLDWVAPQDWMCEPFIIAKTGLTVREHQLRTVSNFLDLRLRAPELPVIPVVQGWTLSDYMVNVEDYAHAGMDLRHEPTVGVGSVCRRQNTKEAEAIIRAVAGCGIKVHGFGFKLGGIKACADVMTSADSMAWSFGARRSERLPGCVGHKNCANCLKFALLWREKILAAISAPKQPPMFVFGALNRWQRPH